MSSFKHSGDAGDVVYSLCTVKALGGGVVHLANNAGVRVPFTEKHYRNVAPLVEMQPYVKRVCVHDGRDVLYNLDLFRKQFSLFEHLGKLHLKAFGLDTELLETPWLTADKTKVERVVINLTPRYRNRFFPWIQIYRKYGKAAVFVGSPAEHAQFESCYGPIRYYPTEDYAKLAAVINGADLFIGNQSSPLAIASGLGKEIVCEISQETPNCILNRKNYHCSGGGTVFMPGL